MISFGSREPPLNRSGRRKDVEANYDQKDLFVLVNWQVGMKKNCVFLYMKVLHLVSFP